MSRTNIDSFGQFLNDAGRITLLTADEEIYLGKRVQAMQALKSEKPRGPYGKIQTATLRRGQRAKERMVNANLRLVVNIARKYAAKNQHTGLTIDDLVQEGCIGLMRAVEKFDPTRGYKFSTYAFWWIKQAMTRFLNQRSRMIRLPHHVADKAQQLSRTMQDESIRLGRAPTREELAVALNIKREELETLIWRGAPVLSLDAVVTDDYSSALISIVADPVSLERDDDDIRQQIALNSPTLAECIARLTERERYAVIRHFGLDGAAPDTMIQISKVFGLSRERVRQIVTKAQRKLRFYLSQAVAPPTEALLNSRKRAASTEAGTVEKPLFALKRKLAEELVRDQQLLPELVIGQ